MVTLETIPVGMVDGKPGVVPAPSIAALFLRCKYWAYELSIHRI